MCMCVCVCVCVYVCVCVCGSTLLLMLACTCTCFCGRPQTELAIKNRYTFNTILPTPIKINVPYLLFSNESPAPKSHL